MHRARDSELGISHDGDWLSNGSGGRIDVICGSYVHGINV